MSASAVPACPTCKQTVPSDGAHRPFCSSRCKWVDLGRWFDGDYVVQEGGVIQDGLVLSEDGVFLGEGGVDPEAFGLGGWSAGETDDR